ncbi:MAG: carotenoid oxygenase family protein [Myxococcota bacterium]
MDNPYFSGPFGPVEREIDEGNLTVEGEIPRDLHGSYVRNGPNAKYAPKGRYHWFDGDGMLHALRFGGGRVAYRNRYVRTRGLAADDAKEVAQWSGLLEPTKANPKGAPYKDTANTDVVAFQNRLIASWYICGEPYVVDPETLETEGPTRFGHDAPLRISAHAKVDERTRELLFFNYGVTEPYLHYGVVDEQLALRHYVPIDLPGPRLPHDMAATENYSILMDLPFFYRPEALQKKKWVVGYYPDLPSRFGIVPRHGSDVRWFEAEPCYIYHIANAWEEDNAVVMVGCRVVDPAPAPDPQDGEWAKIMANLRITATFHRWRFDLETGETTEEDLDDRNNEFPAINNRYLGRKSRYSYHVGLGKTQTLTFASVIKYDAETDRADTFEFGDRVVGSEVAFGPADGGTAEDDGYLSTFVTNLDTMMSEGWLFDARAVADGPIAKIKLPQRVPLGFHGCWLGGS